MNRSLPETRTHLTFQPTVRPLRIAALQPSISILLDQLGALDLLVACTKYCVDAVPSLRDRAIPVIRDSWSCTTEEILSTQPNLVLASVPYRMETLAAILKAGVAVLTLAPHTLDDIYADINLLGRLTHRIDASTSILAHMQQTFAAMQQRAQTAAAQPLVYAEEWGKPLIHSQPWVDELITIAGGRTFGQPGKTTDAGAIREADPDVMLFAWCGAGDRVPLEKIVEQRQWSDLHAVRSGHVYCIPDEWLNTPAPTLVRGCQAIAAAVQPDIFHELQSPRRLRASLSGPAPSNMV